MPDPDEKKKEEKKTEEVTNGQILQGLRYLASELKRIEGRMDEGRVDPPDDSDKDVNLPTDEQQLERMSRVDFGKYIVANMTKSLEGGLLKSLNERLGQIEGNFDKYKATQDVEKARGSLKDFDKWTDEIKGVLKDHPTLSVDEAYALAKTRNTSKAEELTAAERKSAEEAQKKEAAARRPFGGLLPTSGLTAPNDKMSTDQAANAAFDAILPGVKNLEDFIPSDAA